MEVTKKNKTNNRKLAKQNMANVIIWFRIDRQNIMTFKDIASTHFIGSAIYSLSIITCVLEN